MPPAAWELHTSGTAHSAVQGHPGFLPDDYLAGLGPPTAITAAESYTAGLRERVPGGCHVLDGEAIEMCMDRIRELRKTPRPAPGNGNEKTSTTPTWRTPCWQPAMRGVAERRPHAWDWWHQEDSPPGGSSGPAPSRARLPVPAGPGLRRREAIRPGVPGMFTGWPGARAFATGLVFPFVLAAASSAAMIAAGAATRKSRILSRT